MKILHVMPSFYPATYYGGPIFSTYAMCNALARLPDIKLRVLTSDMAGPDISQRVPTTDLATRFPNYDVHVTRRTMRPDIAPGLLSQLWGMVGWSDVVLLTGTYSFPTIPTLLVCRLRGKPVLWSPRGALKASHDWQGANRRGLKRLWERICLLVRPHRCVLHVTTEMEKEASLARLPGLDAFVAANGVDVPADLPARDWQPGGTLRLMALGRLDTVKALENIIRALPEVRVPATLDVYGDGDQSYARQLLKLTEEQGLAQRVTFHGNVAGPAKLAAFMAADLLVLASHSENFSMVVAEALAHGVPVIVSRGAPWPEIEPKGCGKWVNNDPQTLAAAIEGLRGEDLAAMGARGREWMLADFSWESRSREMKSLFVQLVSSGTPT
ncbi:MAG: glycosyltransferase [Hyphomicrobium sp.]